MTSCALCNRPFGARAVRGNHTGLPFCDAQCGRLYNSRMFDVQQRIGPLYETQGAGAVSSSSDSTPLSATSAAAATSLSAVQGSSDPVPVRSGDGVYIANSTITWPGGRSIGLGLFAGRAFSAGDYITWYYGRREPDVPSAGAALPDTSEHKLSLGYGYTADGQRVPYIIDGTRTPDGTPITNPAVQLAVLEEGGAAWANDVGFQAPPGAVASIVPPGAINNARFVLLPAPDGNARNAAVYLQALVDIPRNTEIFVDYGPHFRRAPALEYGGGSARSRGKRTAPPRKLLAFEENPDLQ